MSDYTGPERRRGGDPADWAVALARVEGKLDAIIASQAALTVSVADRDAEAAARDNADNVWTLL